MQIPTTVAEVTAEWLTGALRAGGLSELTVTALKAAPLGQGQGFASQLLRLSPHYHPDSAPGPASLVAKLPPSLASDRQLLVALGHDRREVAFYSQLAGRAGVRTPRCYFSSLNSAGEGALLLEDLAHARVVSQAQSCTLAEAELALASLAQLHASFWNAAELKTLPGFDEPQTRLAGIGMLYEARRAAFQRLTQDWLPAAMVEQLPQIAAAFPEALERLQAEHCTLCHGDYRLENLLFLDAPAGPTLCVIDWQLSGWNLPGYDLAYFLGQSLTPELRRAQQDALLSTYLRELRKAGVHDYSQEQLVADYRLGLAHATLVPVIFAQTLEDAQVASQGEGPVAQAARAALPGQRRLFELMARRAVSALLDND